MTDVPFYLAWIVIGLDLLIRILPVVARWYYLNSRLFQIKWVLCKTTDILIQYKDSQENDVVVFGVKIDFGRYSLTREIFKQWKFRVDPNVAVIDYVTLIGEINSNGFIHGFGFWQESIADKESLIGFWRYGRPIGPYKSWIVDSTSSIAGIVAGYCRCDPNENMSQAGIAYVEACVTGEWFVGYPKAHFLRAPEHTQSPTITDQVISFFKGLIHPKDDIPSNDVSSCESDDVDVPRRPDGVDSQAFKEGLFSFQVHWMISKLKTANRMPYEGSEMKFKVTAKSDIAATLYDQVALMRYSSLSYITDLSTPAVTNIHYVVYIHGFNNTTYESAQVIGQLIASANYSSNLQFIIFSWPSGQGITQGFQYAKDQSNNREVQLALYMLIYNLYQNGCTTLSFICHSMGCRLLLKLCDWAVESNLFLPLDENEPTKKGANLQLKSITLIQPCVYIGDFLNVHFPVLRKYCSVITMYGNAKDNALFWADVISRKKKNLGRTGILMCYYTGLQADEMPQEIMIPKIKDEYVTHVSSGEDRRWLDMDIIDTTPMDSNISGQRHTFFNINRLMVDDISDIVQYWKRAKKRRRLENRIGNVWCFRTAPSCVKGTWS